jgi:hypothetical protein
MGDVTANKKQDTKPDRFTIKSASLSHTSMTVAGVNNKLTMNK